VGIWDEKPLRVGEIWEGWRGSVLLYFTSAGSMARAARLLVGVGARRGVGRTAMVVACHAGECNGELLAAGNGRL